jgi:phage tail-like protein
MWDLPVAFYFSVVFPGSLELEFKEVSGLSVELEYETVAEGGVNYFEHKLPKKSKHGNLVLKRALQPIAFSLIEIWIKSTIEYGFSVPIIPVPISIFLKNAQGIPIRGWACTNAYPVKWETDSLDSEKNTVLIETIEFAYQELIRLM